MGFMFLMADCIACRQPFSCNPDRVPSIRARWVDGKLQADPSAPKQPICRTCIERSNIKRRELGLPETRILPGAYEAAEGY